MNVIERRQQDKEDAKKGAEIINRRSSKMTEGLDEAMAKAVAGDWPDDHTKVENNYATYRPLPISQEKSVQQLILEAAAQLVGEQTHDQRKLASARGDFFKLLLLHANERIQPDELSDLILALGYFCEIITNKHHDRDNNINCARAIASAADTAINGHQARMETSIKGRMA